MLLTTIVFAIGAGIGFGLAWLLRGAEQRRTPSAEKASILEAVFENVDQGIGLIDKDLIIVACNRRLLELLDLPDGSVKPGDRFETVLRLLAEQGEFGDGDKEAAVADRLRLARSNREVLVERPRPNGGTLQVRSRPLADGGLIITYTDVSEIKRRDAASHQSQKMEALGQLTGGIAHDFNNLLTVIVGGSAELKDKGDLDEKSRRLAGMIEHAGNRASELTSRLLAFSRRQALHAVDFDLNNLAQHTIGMLGRIIGAEVTIKTDFSPDACMVHADPSQCETALLNLAINARDAMPHGGEITIATRVEPDHGLLIVRDTGQGMTKEIQERLFEPFFTTKEKGAGTGLGLAMVYGYVRQSGGEIHVASEPGAGAEIRVKLPRRPGTKPARD